MAVRVTYSQPNVALTRGINQDSPLVSCDLDGQTKPPAAQHCSLSAKLDLGPHDPISNVVQLVPVRVKLHAHPLLDKLILQVATAQPDGGQSLLKALQHLGFGLVVNPGAPKHREGVHDAHVLIKLSS